jgi:hypothetical protein
MLQLLWSNLKYYGRICVEETGAITIYFYGYGRWPGRELNTRPPEYETGMLRTPTWRTAFVRRSSWNQQCQRYRAAGCFGNLSSGFLYLNTVPCKLFFLIRWQVTFTLLRRGFVPYFLLPSVMSLIKLPKFHERIPFFFCVFQNFLLYLSFRYSLIAFLEQSCYCWASTRYFISTIKFQGMHTVKEYTKKTLYACAIYIQFFHT